MDLKSQVTAHLRNGSINVPGRDAVDVLAFRLDSKKNEVRNVLVELLAEGTLDLAGGTVRNTSFIALRQEFRPRTEQGRKESKYAVDQRGNHYRGTATGGPLITRQATLEEWVRMGNDASTYTFGTPANEIQVQEATPIMDASVPKPKTTSRQMNDRALKGKTLENVEKIRQKITEEVARSTNGLIPSELFRVTAAKELGVGNATMVKYISLLKKEGFCAFVQFERAYYIMLVGNDEQASSTDVAKKPPKKQKAMNPRTATKLSRVEELRALIAAELQKSPSGLLPSNELRQLAAEELGVGMPSINDYLRVLTDEHFVEYTRNGVKRGIVYIKLVEQRSMEDKLNMVLELLRTLSRKRNSRLPLKDEVAKLLKTTPDFADTGFLKPLRKLGMYRTERQSSKGNLFVFKLVYVQPHPITQQQLTEVREIRSKHKRTTKQVEPATPVDTPAVNEPIAAKLVLPDVVLNESEPDEITQLITELVETNEAQAAELARLNAANASLDQHLAEEVDRLTTVNNLLEQQLIEALEKRDFYHVLAEAERTRPIVVTPAKPTLPEDLLQRARAALVTQVRNHLRPPAEGDDIV